MIRRVVVFAALFGTAAHRVAAQGPTLLLVGDPEASAQIEKIVGATKLKGLPTDPILAKVRYGVVVSHAPAPRIVAAAQAVASRLEVARDALAPRATELDIVAGEGALSFGASTQGLRAVRAASQNQPLAVPLGVLSQLLESGVPADRATAIVTNLIRRGAAEQLVALGNDVSSDVLRGAQATSALDIRTRGLNAVLPPLGTNAAADPALGASSTPKKP